jgi:hypothetical protein
LYKEIKKEIMSFEEFLKDVVAVENKYQPLPNRSKWTVFYAPHMSKDRQYDGFIREVSFDIENPISSDVVKDWFLKTHQKSLDTYFFNRIVG